MAILDISESLLQEALAQLRGCGAGLYECVCWLSGPLEHPSVIDRAIHPRHTATAGGYAIDEDWIHATFVSLARAQRELRAQMHTHPGDAYHSRIDDEYPAVPSPGFLSIVVPNFAQGQHDLRDAHVARLEHDGRWHTLMPAQVLAIS